MSPNAAIKDPQKTTEPPDGLPAGLLPVIGDVATDRTQVQTVVLTALPVVDPPPEVGASAGEGADDSGDAREPAPPGRARPELTGQVDVARGRPALYDEPAVGVVVTTQQEWTPQRLGLGRLLHSLPLAPGESTRVAVVDWTRQTTGTSDETTAQGETVTEEAARDRGVTEITAALLAEEQSGSSSVSTRSSSRSGGGSVGWLWGGASASSAANTGLTTSVSRSSGSKNLSAKTAQRISERTQQLATSFRDRRASVVKETFEAETAQASTRVVTNYNHMHSLTVQYWEVVQEYSVSTSTKKVERCLFVPMKVIDFDGAAFRRYAAVLAAAAPPGHWRDRLALIDPLELGVFRTRSNTADDSLGWTPLGGWAAPRLKHFQLFAPTGTFFGVTQDNPAMMTWHPETGEWKPGGIDAAGQKYGLDSIDSPDGSLRLKHRSGKRWSAEPYSTSQEYQVGEVTYACHDGIPVMRGRVDAVAAEAGTSAAGPEKLLVWSADQGIIRVELRMRGGGEGAGTLALGEVPDDGPAPAELDFSSTDRLTSVVLVSETMAPERGLRQIRITTEDHPEELRFGAAPEIPDEVALDVRGGVPCGLFGTVAASHDGTWTRVLSLGFTVRGPRMAQDILDHLNDNALYYSQAIWATADELTLSPIMAMTVPGGDGTPLGLQLDPQPIALTGNYLGFVWHFPDDEARQAWCERHDLVEGSDTAPSMTVSLPTDGVFAEAVLGRSNAAERLDLTRFWDWQSSPIPIVAPEISPVSTDSRAGTVDTSTGALAPTAATIHQLSGLPDPSGLAATLQALTTANVFRDMSGLAEASAVLQKGIEQATTADAAAAANATRAMEVAGENITKVAKAATDVASTFAPMLAGPAGAGASALGKLGPSFVGALVNASGPVGDGDGGAVESGESETGTAPSTTMRSTAAKKTAVR